MFWYLHTWWECLCTSCGRVKQKGWLQRSMTGQQQAPSTEVFWSSLLELFHTSPRKQMNVNSAIWLCGMLYLPWLRDQGDEKLVSLSLAEPFFSSILTTAAVNYSYYFCHVQSSSVLHAVGQQWCNLIQQWGNPVPSAKREVSLSWFIIIQRDGATIAILPQRSPKRKCSLTCWEFLAVQSEFS